MQEASSFPKSVSLPAALGSFTQKLPDLQLEGLLKLPPIPGRWQCISMRFQALGNLTERHDFPKLTMRLSASLTCVHTHTHTHSLSRMITGAARNCNSRLTDYIRRQAGKIACTRIYRKTNTVKLVTLLELHLLLI